MSRYNLVHPLPHVVSDDTAPQSIKYYLKGPSNKFLNSISRLKICITQLDFMWVDLNARILSKVR